MLNFGASKPRVKGRPGPQGPPPLDPHLDLHSKILDRSPPSPTRSSFLYFMQFFGEKLVPPLGLYPPSPPPVEIFSILRLENEEGCCPYCFFRKLRLILKSEWGFFCLIFHQYGEPFLEACCDLNRKRMEFLPFCKLCLHVPFSGLNYFSRQI